MNTRVFSSSDHTGKVPDWYWRKGLHDAHILRTEDILLPFDHTQPNPCRNCFTIHLDASQAMFDTGVKSISLYNYKVIVDESGIGGYGDGLDGCYWMQDNLKYENGKYLLDIIALGEDDFHYIIRFEKASIERIK